MRFKKLMESRVIGVLLIAVGLGIGAGSFTYAALAATAAPRVGPPTVNTAFGEYEYAPGSVVYLCVDQATQVVRAETRTDVAGNCAAGEVQLPDVVPTPYPAP
jgi:hypothetical protein